MGKNAKFKQMRKATAAIRNKLPLVMRNTHEVHYMDTMEYCQAMGIDPREKKKVLEAEELYHKWTGKGAPGIPMRMPVQIYVNHDRGMKKAYQRSGTDGLADYIKKQVELVHAHEAAAKKEEQP